VSSDRHGNWVDLLTSLRALDLEAFSRLITVPVQGDSLRVIDREDLVAMKCSSGEPLDLVDARRASL
jgi:hypothetical protein